MGEILRRLTWFLILGIAVSYGTYLFLGNAIQVDASGSATPIVIRDQLERGIHHLSGMVQVSSLCKELSVHPVQVDTNTYMLDFSTWEEPSVPCPKEDTPRSFRSTVFAPSVGVSFIARIDEVPLRIAVYPVIDSH